MDEIGNTTVFIGGVAPFCTEETLASYFIPFGDILSIKLVPPKACAFIQYVSHYSAEQAIENMNGFLLGATKLKVSWGRGADACKQKKVVIPVRSIVRAPTQTFTLRKVKKKKIEAKQKTFIEEIQREFIETVDIIFKVVLDNP